MNWTIPQMYELFTKAGNARLLLDGSWGLEKESQRVTRGGDLALTDHPASFGDKTTNPWITTDFSESQLELITPPFGTIEAAHADLIQLHATVVKGIGNELLWPLSMPPRLPDEELIPIARFGSGPGSVEQEIYRRGLALRYGKKMQMISGIHYNFSFGAELLDALYREFGGGKDRRAFSDDLYFSVARNFLRYRWLLIYLFGSSPSHDRTYESVICKELKLIKDCCPEYCGIMADYKRFATSLRVSRFGYSGQGQGEQWRFFNQLDEYQRGIRGLMATRSQRYRKLGIYRDGYQVQLNDRILQKESEFYAPLRFKQPVHHGERPLDALDSRGVSYLEIRTPDLDPFEPSGIGLAELRFMQIFMLYCLFESSPAITKREFHLMNLNHHATALFGRAEDLQLMQYRKGNITLKAWGHELFAKLAPIALLLDQANTAETYQNVLRHEAKKLTDRSLLPSSRMEREMENHGESFLDFGVRQALTHQQHFVTKESQDVKPSLPGVGAIHPDPYLRGESARDFRGSIGPSR